MQKVTAQQANKLCLVEGNPSVSSVSDFSLTCFLLHHDRQRMALLGHKHN